MGTLFTMCSGAAQACVGRMHTARRVLQPAGGEGMDGGFEAAAAAAVPPPLWDLISVNGC